MQIKCVNCKKVFEQPTQPDGRGRWGARACSPKCRRAWHSALTKRGYIRRKKIREQQRKVWVPGVDMPSCLRHVTDLKGGAI